MKKNYIVSILAKICLFFNYGLQNEGMNCRTIISHVGVSSLVFIIELAFILFFQGLDEIIDHFVIGRCNS